MTDKIKAPQGMVYKGYLISNFGNLYIRRCLVDEWGLVFVSGRDGGWANRQDQHTKVKILPKPVARTNAREGWSWSQWWRKNWQCDSWAWMYGRQSSDFVGFVGSTEYYFAA